MMIKETVKADRWFIVLAMIGVLLAGLYAFWFFSTHHKVDHGIRYTPKSEVRQNRYFTAEKLINKSGGHALTFQKKGDLVQLDRIFGDIDDAKNNMVMIYQLTEERDSKLTEMIDWVSAGGHLVVFNKAFLPYEASTVDEVHYTKNQNPLLKHMGIKYIQYETKAHDALASAKMDMDKLINPLKMGDELVIAGSNMSYYEHGHFVANEFFDKYPNAKPINYDWRQKTKQGYTIHATKTTLSAKDYSLIDKALNQKDAWADDKPILFDPDSLIFDSQLGQGRLTVLSDNRLFTNPSTHLKNNNQTSPTTQNTDWQMLTGKSDDLHGYMGGILKNDNAELLLRLVGDRTVYFVPDIASEGFFELLGRYLAYTILGFFLTVGATLLALPRQFGAVKSYETDKKRNIIGFFAHVGRYLWRSDEGGGLLSQNRQILLRVIYAKEHISDKDDLVSVLSQKTGLSAGLIHEALYADWQSEQEFLRISQSFKTLANHFEK